MRGAARTAMSVVLALVAVAPAPADTLPAAASDEHLFILVPERDPARGRRLLHHARTDSGPWARPLRAPIRRRPEAMAAHGARLWLVFPPGADDGERARRAVFTLKMVSAPGLSGWVSDPPDRLSIEPSLPGVGRLDGFVGAPDGPIALIVGDDGPRLLALDGTRWRDVPPPSGLEGATALRLVPPRADGAGLGILARMDGGAVLHGRDAAGAWDEQPVPWPDDATLAQVLRIGDRPAVVRRRDVRPTGIPATVLDDRAFRLESWHEIAYLRPGVDVPLAAFAPPAESWAVVGLADGGRLIRRRPSDDADDAETRIRRLDPVTGVIGPEAVMESPPPPADRVWHLSVLLAIAVTATLLVVVFRPAPRGPIELPAQTRLQGPIARVFGLAVDLLPGGAVAVVLLGAAPEDLVRAPLFAPDLGDSGAFLVMVAVTGGHTTLTELLARRTIGKWVTGARIVALDGTPPTALRLVLRGLLKSAELCLPPLILLALLSPTLQAVHDLVAGTVVVERDDEGSEGLGD